MSAQMGRWLGAGLALGLSAVGCAAPVTLPTQAALSAGTTVAPLRGVTMMVTPTPVTAATSAPSAWTQEAPIEAPPARLIIPDMKLDRPIMLVPIHDGDWDLAVLGDGVGRLDSTGERPLDALAPILIGHVSLQDGTAGPFGYLWRLGLDDMIQYEWEGRRYTYRVESKRLVAPDAVGDIYVADGRRLLLVTCDGWDLTHWTYTKRLVVSAVLQVEGEQP